MRGREGVFSEAMQAVENALAAGLLVDLYVVLRRENMPHLQRLFMSWLAASACTS